ncbi:MAG: type II toxin-antitoxin system RelE/ParE family toxin [Acidimicrobiaceae bacterium]|nr:type II toxin-antitoxin system RelE/ParE family toxin [Acidimicrobiaceae bacterium]MDE0498536.1 type II toxin-antitoxin system RelE/ParE family toxin [Acidimicrobiaceae bacterium]
MPDEPWELSIAPPAQRDIASRLPAAVVHACLDYIEHAVLLNPWRVGKPLRWELAGVWSARQGDYRVLYEIDEPNRTVVLLRVAHRRDAYRRT